MKLKDALKVQREKNFGNFKQKTESWIYGICFNQSLAVSELYHTGHWSEVIIY